MSEDDEDEGPRIPMSVLIASVVWMTFGVFVLVSYGAFIGITGDGLTCWASLISLSLGSGFFVIGLQTLLGKTSQLARYCIGSIVIGVFVCFVGSLFLLMGVAHIVVVNDLRLAGLGFGIFLLGLSLIVVGYLAIKSRVAYCVWQQYRISTTGDY